MSDVNGELASTPPENVAPDRTGPRRVQNPPVDVKLGAGDEDRAGEQAREDPAGERPRPDDVVVSDTRSIAASVPCSSDAMVATGRAAAVKL